MTCRGTRKWNLSSYEIVLLIHHSSSSSSSSRFARNPTNCPPTHLPFFKNPSYPNLYPLHPLDCSLSCPTPSPLFRTGGDVRINSLVTWSKWRKKEKLEQAVPRERFSRREALSLSLFPLDSGKITENRWRKRERERRVDSEKGRKNGAEDPRQSGRGSGWKKREKRVRRA